MRGCSFLESGISFEADRICDCCISHGTEGQGLPLLIDNYHGENIDWETLFKTKQKRIEQQKISDIYECAGCYRLGEYTFGNKKKISDFHFTVCHSCNAKCIYCSKEYNASSVNYDAYGVLNDLIEKGYYESGGEATLQGGEPTLMKSFDKIVDLFLTNGTSIRVHTNGIIFSEKLSESLKQNKAIIVISLDSATAQMYHTIKQVDKFNDICTNIRKYTNAAGNNTGAIVIKYIIIPGINDNINEIKKFFKLMQKLNVKSVALDLEVQYARKHQNKDVSKHIFYLTDYFEYLAKKYNMHLAVYSFLTYVLENRTIKKLSTVNNDFICNLIINLNKDKKKNLQYLKQ